MTTETALSDLKFLDDLRDKVRSTILFQGEIPMNSFKVSFSVFTDCSRAFDKILHVSFRINDQLYETRVHQVAGALSFDDLYDNVRKTVCDKLYEALTLSDGYKESLGAFFK